MNKLICHVGIVKVCVFIL